MPWLWRDFAVLMKGRRLSHQWLMIHWLSRTVSQLGPDQRWCIWQGSQVDLWLSSCQYGMREQIYDQDQRREALWVKEVDGLPENSQVGFQQGWSRLRKHVKFHRDGKDMNQSHVGLFVKSGNQSSPTSGKSLQCYNRTVLFNKVLSKSRNTHFYGTEKQEIQLSSRKLEGQETFTKHLLCGYHRNHSI